MGFPGRAGPCQSGIYTDLWITLRPVNVSLPLSEKGSDTFTRCGRRLAAALRLGN